MKRTNKIFLIPMFLFLIMFIAQNLLAEQDCVSKTVYPHLSLPHQGGGIQGDNEYSPPLVGGVRACPVPDTGGGGELLGVSKPSPKLLTLSQTTIGDPKSANSNPSKPQSAIQNLSPTTTGVPQLDKAEFARKTKKLQIPFVANNGQVDEQVRFYAKTFGGTVFVTKDGEIVYALPHTAADASPLVHYDIDKKETGHTGLTGFPGKEGRCIVHRTLCALYPYCLRNFPVYYSETISPLSNTKSLSNTETNSPLSNPESDSLLSNTESNSPFVILSGAKNLFLNNSPSEILNPKHVLDFDRGSSIPTTRRDTERRVPTTTTVALKEEFVGAKVATIQGEQPSVTKVNYFKGSDPEKWKTDISTYDFVNLGEIYKGIDLKLKAYGDNVEKLFHVKPGANPDQIKIRLSGIQPSVSTFRNGKQPPESPFSKGDFADIPLNKGGEGVVFLGNEKGARGLSINEHGELVAETELGPVKFTKPVAYQEIDGKRVEVEVAYQIENCKLQNAEQGRTHPLPLSRGEYKSPLSGEKCRNPLLGEECKSPLSELEYKSPLLGRDFLGSINLTVVANREV